MTLREPVSETASTGRVGWYARRLGRMTPAEVLWRVWEQVLRRIWAWRHVPPGRIPEGPPRVLPDRRFTAVLPPGAASGVPEPARTALVADADRILKGEWEMLGVTRTDMDAPDWFSDPVTGRRSDPARFAFRINQRSEDQVGNIKQVWELSRLQHLTLLAAAWYLTGAEPYALRVAEQLRSWWESNPYLSGVNWTSGIEVGIRLLNFVWIRRLLASWPGVPDLFEENGLALRQIRWHQEYLAAFESRGSSANNHVIAEAAGQLAASCAFGWFPESQRWRRSALRLLERSLRSNTFPSGINRELATDYHGFVFELGVFAALEASAAGSPVSEGTWRLLCSMADCMAALVDEKLRPPRQGDSDEGRVVLLDSPAHNRWPALLSLGAALFGDLDWWPRTAPDAAGTLAAALAGGGRGAMRGGALGGTHGIGDRPAQRPSRFPDAGITILRTGQDASPEIWCRCDGGPHGFLSIAAHAHADALSIEVRYGGVDILADPGTYCYHGEQEWRSYFRSTIAHNALDVAGRSQSSEGGPFMWLRRADSTELDASAAGWTAEHDGYTAIHPAARHRRTVRLHEVTRAIEITDSIDAGGHEIRLAFHFGPEIDVELNGNVAALVHSSAVIGWLELPDQLAWTRHRGETEPILGWYSPNLGTKVPAYTLLGSGSAVSERSFLSRLVFTDGRAPQTGVER